MAHQSEHVFKSQADFRQYPAARSKGWCVYLEPRCTHESLDRCASDKVWGSSWIASNILAQIVPAQRRCNCAQAGSSSSRSYSLRKLAIPLRGQRCQAESCSAQIARSPQLHGLRLTDSFSAVTTATREGSISGCNPQTVIHCVYGFCSTINAITDPHSVYCWGHPHRNEKL